MNINMLTKRSLAFVIDYVVALSPLWLLSPFIFLYIFSDSGANQFVSWTALVAILFISPLLYVLFQFCLTGPRKSLGRYLMKIEVDYSNQNWFIVTLLRTSPIIIIMPTILLSAWPLLLIYPAFALWRKDNKSISDLISSSQSQKAPAKVPEDKSDSAGKNKSKSQKFKEMLTEY